MAQQIFISYSRKDTKQVSLIAEFLKQNGYSVWFDTNALGVGDDWPESIVKGIKECSVFILAISPNANNSPNVKKEIYLAGEEKRTILPLAMEAPLQLSDGMRYHLAGLQHIHVCPPIGLSEVQFKLKEILSDRSDLLAIDASLTEKIPDINIEIFSVRETINSVLRTMTEEVPLHLIKLLSSEQEEYYLPESLPEYRENALRRLRNHGLLEHDGTWLFTPTRSRRVWASPLGELLIEASLRPDAPQTPRLLHLCHQITEKIALIVKQPALAEALKALEAGQNVPLDQSFRFLRNHSFITCRRLSTKIPLLHELTVLDFNVTNLGKFALTTLNKT